MKEILITKRESGVTLIALVVTVIALLIIVAITINYGVSEIHDVTNKKLESDLGTVQGAIMQRYALVQSLNQLGIIPSEEISENVQLSSDTERPSGLVGIRLADSNYITNNGFPSVTLESTYTSSDEPIPFEKYYYLLTKDDLADLGINKGNGGINLDDTSEECSYIVNYFTGEVFDIVNKKYYKTSSKNDDPVYKKPTAMNIDSKNYFFDDN